MYMYEYDIRIYIPGQYGKNVWNRYNFYFIKRFRIQILNLPNGRNWQYQNQLNIQSN